MHFLGVIPDVFLIPCSIPGLWCWLKQAVCNALKKTHEFSPVCTLSSRKPSPLHPHRRIFSVKFMMLTNNEINLSCSSLSISIMRSLTDNAMRCVVEEEKKLCMRRISEVRSRVLDGVVSLIHDTSWSADRKKHILSDRCNNLGVIKFSQVLLGLDSAHPSAQQVRQMRFVS